MRYLSLLISLLFFSFRVFGQEAQKQKTSRWDDTSFSVVRLVNNNITGKVVVCEIGQKAVIYLRADSMIIEAKKGLKNDFVKKDEERIIEYLDSGLQNIDTLLVDHYRLAHFKYLVSSQLEAGIAKVFYKKLHLFVDTIYHRLEKYGGTADRFFYLPDKRPFYFVMEYSGILENDDDPFSGNRYAAYKNEGEKIAGIRKE